MTRTLALPHLVKRELARLSANEVAALRGNDLPSYVHSRLLWAELVLTAAPQLTTFAPQLGFHVAHLLPGADRPLPRWKLELLARPLVPIVSRKVTTLKLPGGRFSHGAIETLACGHAHRLIVVLDGDLRARRRRCKECGAARLLAIDSRPKSIPHSEVQIGNRRLDAGGTNNPRVDQITRRPDKAASQPGRAGRSPGRNQRSIQANRGSERRVR